MSEKILPKIDSDQVKILWINEWYDAPLAGIVLYNGRKHYFDLYEFEQWHYYPEEQLSDSAETDDGYLVHGRYLYLYALTDEQIQMFTERNEEFKQHVGTYWNYDLPEEEKIPGGYHDEKSFHLFYDREWPDPQVTPDQRIGYFEF